MQPMSPRQVEGFLHAPEKHVKRLALTASKALEKVEQLEGEVRELKSCRADVFERTMPQNLGAERAVLGSILLKPATLTEVRPILQAKDFYDDANRKIYEHLLRITPIDVLLLCESLRRAGDYEDIGGAAYLAEIGRQTPTAAHAKYYAEIVVQKAAKRAAIHRALDEINEAFEDFRKYPRPRRAAPSE